MPGDTRHGSGAQNPGPPAIFSRIPQHASRDDQKLQVTQWNPRDGRGDAFTLWERSREAAVKQHLLHLVADRDPPTLADIRGIMPRASAAQLKKQLDDAVAEYQELNTRYFELVRPSLDVYKDRRHWEEDHTAIESYSIVTPGGKIISDGNGLVAWARKFTDVSSLAHQGDIRLRLASTKLSKGATVIQLDDHIHSLWCDWHLLHETNTQHLKPFWAILLFSIPTEPESSLLTQVRSRLANAIADEAPVLADYATTRTMLVSYARTIGIKETGPPGTVNPIGGGAPPGADGAKKDNNWSTNDCSRCPLKACQANQRKRRPDGSVDCLGRPDSTFNVALIKDRMRRQHVEIWRAYSKAHPNDKDLKDEVKIKTWFKAKKAEHDGKSDSSASASKPAGSTKTVTFDNKQVTAVFMSSILGVPHDEITNPDLLEQWLNGNGSYESVCMIGADSGEGSKCSPSDDDNSASSTYQSAVDESGGGGLMITS